ncbi:hypothetical protein [Streptomyces sp. NPDC053542]|uniref:hypothetical protein n=1 Tax=Streptomyces sp. NPDC053542 TaxID=3365710 RepID=UPI0037D07554
MAIGEQQHEWVTIAANKPGRYHWIVAGALVVVCLSAGLWLGSVRLLVAAGTALICLLVLARIGSACRVTVTEKDVQYRGILGRTRRIPRGDIATVLYAPYLDTGHRRHGDWLLLLDGQGRPLLRLTSHVIWPPQEIKRVSNAVGGPTVNMPGAKARTVRQHYPKAIPYHVAHPNVFGGIFGGLLVAVIVIVTVFAVVMLNQ